jgi:hypothetical protein
MEEAEARKESGRIFREVQSVWFSHNKPTRLWVGHFEKGESKMDEVKAKLKCWGTVEDVINTGKSTNIFMRYPYPSCVLRGGVLVCRPEEE